MSEQGSSTGAGDHKARALRLMGMVTQFWVPQALYVAVTLGIAERLADGPRSSEELALQVSANPDRLHRLLRALSSVGVFTEDPDHRFRQTPLSDLLRPEAPMSIAAMAAYFGRPPVWSAWGNLLEAVRSGQPAFDLVHGMPAFDYQVTHPEHASAFNRFMAAAAGERHVAVATAYDFSSAKVVADVGGGHGRILGEILRRNPSVRGMLVDLPHVLAGCGPVLEAAGVSERVTLVEGSFFEFIPPGADVYFLSQILHDWDDARCTTILRNCRAATSPDARLLISELVVPDRGLPPDIALMDMQMMVVLTGKERTEAEFAALLAAAGFKLMRMHPTLMPSRMIIEAVPT
jgi:O-methyltransferase/methyltransferase family protein